MHGPKNISVVSLCSSVEYGTSALTRYGDYSSSSVYAQDYFQDTLSVVLV